ncbi:MAG: T9SS type A sorting domain-containing protein, partial [Bacteroidales bacterium]|nr:T9SS type A sorting domain-containing protein [Bacteroidales bacterium]
NNSSSIFISGTVVDAAGGGIEGVNLNLTGFSSFSTVSDAAGSYVLEAFAEKQYELEVFHPLYIAESMSFTSGGSDYSLDPITLIIALHKPGNVVAVNNNGVGDVNWRIPVGHYNETMIGWGSFITAGDAWGAGGDPFISGIRFETSDLLTQVTEGAELTHVKAYIANNAEIIIKIFEGENAEQLIHSQSASISTEDWYMFELTTSLPIDFDKELWIGIEFLAGEYGAYPIGLDDGPNAPGKKGSMLYMNGEWNQMSLTNKNWNIYGIANNTMEANPTGYKVYRSPASTDDWTELTTAPITATAFSDATLSDADPDMYKYGITAEYGNDLVSEKGISNAIQHDMYFDFTLEIEPDFGSAEGAYISVWNDDNFVEAFAPASPYSVTFADFLRGDYNIRIELDNYEIAELSDVSIQESGTTTVPLNLLKVQPSNLKVDFIEGSTSVTLDWTLHGTYTDQIEKYEDFERDNIGDYILKDLDGLETYTYTNFTWPNAGVPMSFMVFNPYSTTPVVDMEARSGRRFLAGIAGPDGVNNDWLIIPAGTGEFSFWAASLVSTALEKMRVLYSTTGSEVSDFTTFESVITVPADWTLYSFDAPAETKYVAINYVGNDTYILKIDDLTFEKEYNHVQSYNIYLDGELVSANVTETTFVLEDLSIGEHIAEVEAVYETGFSEKTDIEIVIVGLEANQSAEFRIYPNPTSGRFSLQLANKATISIMDMHGRVLRSEENEAGLINIEHALSAGTYIIQVQTAEGVSAHRLVVL